MRRVPTPLLALCAIALLLGTTWSLVTPPFQAPDENTHFSYSEYLARTGSLPGDPKRPRFTTEQSAGGVASNSDQVAGNPKAKMSWSALDRRRWDVRTGHLADEQRRDAGGLISSASNPPLYYLYAAIPARLTAGDNLYTRLTWQRLASMLGAIALMAFAWLLAGEVFGRDRTLQFATAGVAGLLPMVQFISASVSPDALLYPVWTAALWRGTVILRRGITPWNAGIFLALIGAACVIKATGYALVPGALLVLAVGLWRVRDAGSRALLRFAAAGAGLAVTLGAWFFVAHRSNRSAAAQVTDVASGNRFDLHDFLAYLYQYYLPRFPGQGEYPFPDHIEGVPFWNHIMREAFGAYGWTEVRMPELTFVIQMTVFAIVVIGLVVALVRFRRAVDLAVLGFLALAMGGLVAGLQWTDYQILRESGFKAAFNQGRYLLPLAALGGLAAAAAVRVLRPGARLPAIGLLLSGLIVMNVLGLGVSAWRFYA